MKLTFILSILFFYSIGYSQSVVVNFTEKRIVSKEKLEAIPEFARKNALATYDYTLEYSNGVSFYKNNSEVKNVDSVEKSDSKSTKEEVSSNKQEILHKVTNKFVEKWYYADFNKDELLFSVYNGKDFYGKDHLLQWNWQISNETKEINGFQCRKATSEAFGYYFTAWFTEDIAISAGPDKFNGLPGLILYIGTKHYEYVATSVKVNKEPIVIVKPEMSGNTVTMTELERYVKEGVSKLKSGTTNEVKGNTAITRTTTVIR
ncbi:GLPGLI family protein [Flavobacterium sp. Fl-318]|uniref:GLPGLI family protein n=1 Tax=Flavobacterium cupriresistens TaxID=2893885 RepID=A0ABU4RDV0_9FLAO|nr:MULTISPECIES: GLPGLI family protein [unclassified Flavobacterium]MDX6190760.1 GLPGLI family protein [Flavobacterium sp. Fl-318]UFH44066.1 GLPGLI family protein [Flavobacterium sp. F-323]